MKYVEGSKLEVDSGFERREDLDLSYFGGSVRIGSRQGHHHRCSLSFLLEPSLHATYGSNQGLRALQVEAALLR